MRRNLAILALAALGLLVGLPPGNAEVLYPWCAQYSRGGSRNCGFTTWEQCRATVSGVGGYCIENPFYVAARRDWRTAPGPAAYRPAPTEAAPPVRQAHWTATAPRAPWPPDWCSLKGRRGDPKLFLQQQAAGCF